MVLCGSKGLGPESGPASDNLLGEMMRGPGVEEGSWMYPGVVFTPDPRPEIGSTGLGRLTLE